MTYRACSTRPCPTSVITNKHHAQSLRLLFCLLRWLVPHCEAQVWRRPRSILTSFLTKDPLSGKGKRTELGEEPYSQEPQIHPLMPRCLEGNVQQLRKDFLGKETEEALSQPHSFQLSLPQAKGPRSSCNANSMY